MMQQKLFTLDGEKSFVGFSNGETWNGFSCPYSELEECTKIMEAFNKDNEDLEVSVKLVYDEEEDCFIEQDENYDEEEYVVYEAMFINVDGANKKVYALGSDEWTWVEF
jgi:hypothetical protein